MVAKAKGVKVETILKILAFLILVGLVLLSYYYFFLLPKRGGGLVDTVPVDVGNIRCLMVIYGPGTRVNPYFNRPNSVAVGEDGKIYVTDGRNDRICVFNRYGRFLFQFGEHGRALVLPGERATWRPGRFWLPYGIDLDDDGNIYVADTMNGRIQVFNPEGRFLRWFPKGGGIYPIDLHLKGNKIYVTDRSHGRIAVFSLNGKLISSIGQKGRVEGALDGPIGVEVGAGGTVYVADGLNMTLNAFTSKGKLKWVKGKVPKGLRETPREFGLPAGVALDPKGRINVVDAFHFTIQVYSPQGKKLAEVGQRGVEKGTFNFARGLDIDRYGDLYVADMENDRIQKIRILKYVIEPFE